MLRRLVFLGLLLASAGASAPVRAQAPTETRLSPGVRALLAAGDESPELRELRLAEEAMFRYGLGAGEVAGMPAGLTSEVETRIPLAVGSQDLSYLQGIALPDIPMRWDDAVVQYLEYFREDPRGHELMSAWLRRSTRYTGMIEEALREAGLPIDLRCVALAESGFDPRARSAVGAVGMWQFVSVTGDEYGLVQNHWVDERMDPYRATRAAARYLGDLHERLGTWELSLAAYNMGYTALLRAIRKYNSNDYGLLSRIEAGLPFETTVYVAKILSCSVVMRNPERFGFGSVTRDAALVTQSVEVPGGVALSEIAAAADVAVDEVAALNPHLLRRRTPPGGAYAIRLPREKVETFSRAFARRRQGANSYGSYVLRFGERLDDVARRYRTTTANLREINELEEAERVGPGTALLVPNVRPRVEAEGGERPVVAVPEARFVYEGRRRVFYRVSQGDELVEIARFFRVGVDDLVRWNALDPRATLPSGLLLQLFVPGSVDLSRAVVLSESQVRVLVVGSEEFFDYHETQRGRVRMRYRVQTGDTLATIAQRFGLTLGDLSRINRLGRSTRLRAGQELIVYTSRDVAAGREVPSVAAAPTAAASGTSGVTPPPAEAPPASAIADEGEPVHPDPEPAGTAGAVIEPPPEDSERGTGRPSSP